MNWREHLAEQYPEFLLLEPPDFDEAIVGVAERVGGPSCVAYDANKCIKVLMDQGMDYDEAVEFFHFNTAQAYVGEHTPIFIYETKDDDAAD